MIFAALTVVLLAQAPKHEVPFTDVTVRDGRVVAAGREFVVVADRITISPAGKLLVLTGADSPAEFVGRARGKPEFRLAGQRITIDLGTGTFEVVGAGLGRFKPWEK